jgi:hypothetical protein
MRNASRLRTADWAPTHTDHLSEPYRFAAPLCAAETAPCTCLDACERDHGNE